MSDQRPEPSRGSVDIGGRRLVTWCSGSGDPAVVLETGLGAPAADWEAVHKEVASFTSVCHYDRANCGESDPVATPRTARDMANDLHLFIQASSFKTPVVLVGHSFGGPICLVYAATWPEEVAGIVLADPTHPRQFTSIGPLMPDALGPLKEFWQRGWLSTNSTAEKIDFRATFDDVEAITDLGDIPLVVLTSSAWDGLGGNEEAAPDLWYGMHEEYAALSSDSSHRLIAGTDHFLQRCAPEAIVKAVRDVVGGLRPNS